MKTNLLISLLLVLNSFAWAQERSDVLTKQRGLQKLWDFKGSKAGEMYDVKHYELDLIVNPSVYGISGTVTTTFEMKSAGNTITFDLLSNMVVDNIKFNDQLVAFTHLADEINITLPVTLNVNDLASVSISYHGEPQSNGFGAFEQTTHNGSPVLWTLSEPYGAYTWWPCKQSLIDKADSVDIKVNTLVGNRVASNGVLISTEDTEMGVAYHWKHKHPIATYLIAIAVTNYQELLTEVPVEGQNPIQVVDYFYPENSSTWIANQQNVVNAMTAFNNLFITYPYADEKYGHAQFGWGGGMEHQTMSFMYNNSEMLVVHELAHQWFGDYITCGSWADIWINEGFATYCEGLYLEYTYGAPQFKTWRANEISDVTTQLGGSVYCTDTTNVNAIFNGRLSYAKGGQVLHMLRRQIGDEAFFQGMRNYLNDPTLANGFAKTQDFKAHMELAADTILTEYFNDWIYGQGYPKYQITWQGGEETAWVRINQTQSHASVSFFEMKIPVKFSNATRDTIVWFHNTQNAQLFNANIGFRATQATFDPNKEITTKNSTIAQGQLVSVNENLSSSISVYPNPTSNGTIHVVSEHEIKAIDVFTVVGNKVLSISRPELKSEMKLSSGVYVVKVELIDGACETVKVVVE